MVVMVKSMEVIAIRKDELDMSVTGRRISQLICFDDLEYLVDNFNFEEILDLFTKCTFIKNNKIELDYNRFT